MKSPLILLSLLAVSPASAQTIFSAVSNGVPKLFQEQDGTVTAIPTNLPIDAFAALSRDGRFITISSPDPDQAGQTSHDLFIFDRNDNTRRQVINNTSENLGGGSIASRFPRFSSLSPDNSVIAVSTNILITNPQASSTTPILSVHRASDGFELVIPEFGQGAAIDFFRAEHVGISWLPGTSSFVTPSYVITTTQTGQSTAAVGLARFTLTQNGTYQKTPLTAPLVFDATIPSQIQTHIYPAVSPSGAKIAYFEVLWPDALLTQPVSSTLVTINADGSGRTALLAIAQGSYPAGVAWSTDGTQLIFSTGQQAFSNGQYLPEVIPENSFVRITSSSVPQLPSQIPGIDRGFLPFQLLASQPFFDMSNIALQLDTTPTGFLLSAPGLPNTQNFVLESTTTLGGFGTPSTFTGAQLGTGIAISRTNPRQFFRIRNP